MKIFQENLVKSPQQINYFKSEKMDPTARTKLLENIQNDLKNISLETKKTKSLQPIRESTDEAIVKIRSLVRFHYMFS